MHATVDPSLVSSATRIAEHAAARALAEYGLAAPADAIADDRWAECEDDLQAARNLTADYDGQGAVPPPADAIDLALSLTQRLRERGCLPPDDCGAGVNGSIHLGWYRDAGSVEIDIGSTTQVEGYRWRKGQTPAERFLLISAA